MSVLRSDFLVLLTLLIVMLLVVDRHVAPPPQWKDPVPAVVGTTGSGPGGVAIAMAPDPENGRSLFAQTCTSCHGAKAQGLPHQGVDLRVSKFIAFSDAPFSNTQDQIRSNLMRFRLNDPQVSADLKKVIDNLAKHDLTDVAPAIRADKNLRLITDDNMRPEFHPKN